MYGINISVVIKSLKNPIIIGLAPKFNAFFVNITDVFAIIIDSISIK